jgi:hypothetical protein
MTNNLHIIAETLQGNLKESTGNSADAAAFATLNTSLLTKIYPETLVAQIANIQPSKSPVCKIAALYSSYTGSGSNNADDVHYGNSLIITTETASAGLLVAGSTYAVSGSDFKIIYKEDIPATIAPAASPLGSAAGLTTNILIALAGYTQAQWESGTLLNVFSSGTTINGVPVLSYSKNRTALKKMYFNYGKYTTGTGELLKPNQVNFETKTILLDAKSRKTKTTLTYEKIQDMIALYSEKSLEGITEGISNQISQEIDFEIISYLKDIATPYRDVVFNIPLSASIGMQNEITALTDDLYLSAFVMIEDIAKRTKRNRTMFVLADSFTASFLLLNPLHIKPDPDNNNPVRMGMIGAYPLFVDFYSTDNYMMVGYMYDGVSAQGDAGLLYSPYVHEVIEIEDSVDMFKKNLLGLSRYAYTRHPQDSGTGIGDSDFFKICYIDFRGIQNFTQF